jgi:hypothetical protein
MSDMNGKIMPIETKPIMVSMEHKYTGDMALTPAELQMQQDLYDQMQAPTTEVVDFAAEREAYMARRALVQDPLIKTDEEGHIMVFGNVDIDPQHENLSVGLAERVTGDETLQSDPTLF